MRFWLSPEERLPVLCADRSSNHITGWPSIWASTGERNSHVVSVGRFLQPGGHGWSTQRLVCKVTGWHALSVGMSMPVLSWCVSTTVVNMVLMQLFPRVGFVFPFCGKAFLVKKTWREHKPYCSDNPDRKGPYYCRVAGCPSANHPLHLCEESQSPHVQHAWMEGEMHLRSWWATEWPTISGAWLTARPTVVADWTTMVCWCRTWECLAEWPTGRQLSDPTSRVSITGFGGHQSVTEQLTAWCPKAIVACPFILIKITCIWPMFLFVFAPFSLTCFVCLFDIFVCLFDMFVFLFDMFV